MQNTEASSSWMNNKKVRIAIWIIAGVLFIAAMVINQDLDRSSELSQICDQLEEHGKTYAYWELAPTSGAANTTIAELLDDVDMEEAVEASKAGGFESNLNKRGQVVLYLIEDEDGTVVTIYAVDGRIELCFRQDQKTQAVSPL